MCVYTVYIIHKKKSIHRAHLYTSRLMLFPFVVLLTLLFYLFSLSLSFFRLAFSGPPFFSWCALHFGFLYVDCCCCCESLVYSGPSPAVSLYPYCEKGLCLFGLHKLTYVPHSMWYSFYLLTVVDDRHEENVGWNEESKPRRSLWIPTYQQTTFQVQHIKARPYYNLTRSPTCWLGWAITATKYFIQIT